MENLVHKSNRWRLVRISIRKLNTYFPKPTFIKACNHHNPIKTRMVTNESTNFIWFFKRKCGCKSITLWKKESRSIENVRKRELLNCFSSLNSKYSSYKIQPKEKIFIYLNDQAKIFQQTKSISASHKQLVIFKIFHQSMLMHINTRI